MKGVRSLVASRRALVLRRAVARVRRRLVSPLMRPLEDLKVVETRRPPRPFFTELHDHLDSAGALSLGRLVDLAGEQTYGLLILLLALPSLVPGLNLGAAPLGGLAILTLGLQMAWQVPHPWLPRRIREQELHPGRTKQALARVERFLDRFTARDQARRSLSGRWTGLCVAWGALLLMLPVPLPFGNQLPAALLVLMGAALLEGRPSWGLAAALGVLANTVYFALSFRLVLHGCHTLLHAVRSWFA